MNIRTSLGRLGALCVLAGFTAITAWSADMKAGVAKGPITNDKPLVTVNGPVSTGVEKDIMARVLVLNDGDNRLVVVTYDLNCLDVATPLLRKRVEKELGIDKSHLILLATHNHNAPIQINPDNFEFGHWLADRIFGLIQKAIANERGPAKVELGSGNGYFIFSRGNAPTDYEIQMLRVMHGDKPIALLFSHGTHPAQSSEAKIGPGHPGYAMDEVEAAMPGVQAMYHMASGGNQFVKRDKTLDPKLREARKKDQDAVDAVLEEAAKATGHELAEAALAIAKGPFVDVTGPITSSMETLSLPLAPPISKQEALELAKKFPADLGFVDYPHDDRGTNWVRMLLRYYEKDLPFPTKTTDMVCSDDTYLIHNEDKEFLKRYDNAIDDTYPCVYNEVIVAKIGPMPFVAMQGEICAPIGMRVKDTFRGEVPAYVTGYMGEHNLYIPTRELVRQKAYQAQVIQIQYASPVGWDPNVEDEMVNHVIRMVHAILGTS